MEPHNHHRRSRLMRREALAHHRRIDVVTDVVYVTASVSGGGKVVGFTTLGETVEKTVTTSVDPPKVTSKVASSERPRATTSETPRTTEATRTTQSATSSTSESTEKASSTSTFETSTSAVASNSESILAASTSASLSASETSIAPAASSTAPSTEEPASGGMSTGATVGLAVTGVGAFLVICFIVAFVYRKRSQKKVQEAYGKPEDEKTGGAAAGAVYMNGNNNISRANTITSEKAPRVPSLRPVTQFLPNLTVTPPTADPVSQQQPRAQALVPPQSRQQAPVVAASPVGLTRSESRKAPPPALVLTKSGGEVLSAPVSGATTANSAAPLLAKTQPSPTVSSSSSSLAEYTDGGDSAVGTPVTGGAAGAASVSPVHRVQMDFKPSMEDELGLRLGQLVRMLYEYDDGWALCIRLDRSQQGVCPRTCLSQRPVKPRPRPGPSPNSRAQSPIGSQGPTRPYSPANGPRAQSPGPPRPFSPAGGPRAQSPAQMRPQSPAQAYPQSPAGYVKQVYRPATPTQQAQLRIIPAGPVQRPQSPITQSPVAQSPLGQGSPVALRAGPSQITVTTTTPAVIPEAVPSTPVSPVQKPQSLPGSPPRPAVAPVRPSPLSNEQTSDREPEHAQPAFHAM